MDVEHLLRQHQDLRDASGRLLRELHGITLAQIIESLVAAYGWEQLATRVRIDCFAFDPSVKSSLTFLRRTPWARTKVENLYRALRITQQLGLAPP